MPIFFSAELIPGITAFGEMTNCEKTLAKEVTKLTNLALQVIRDRLPSTTTTHVFNWKMDKFTKYYSRNTNYTSELMLSLILAKPLNIIKRKKCPYNRYTLQNIIKHVSP